MRLNVISYNICHGKGIDGVQDLSRTIEVIRQSGADLIGLQEVDRHFGERSEWTDQPALLAEALGMFVVYGVNLDLEPETCNEGVRRQYGNAILSRYPIIFSCNHRLPQVIVPGAWNESRGVLEAHIQMEGETLRFFNTHLGLEQEENAVQVSHLLSLVQASPVKCILTGDFNAVPESAEIKQIQQAFRDTYAEINEGSHTNSFLVKNEGGKPIPDRCIDYIFCSSGFTIMGARVLETFASDHLPLTATLNVVD